MNYRKLLRLKATWMLVVISYIVTGYASAAPYYSNHKPDEFTKVVNPESYALEEPVYSERKATSWGDVDSTQGILPGIYESVLENNDGTLFLAGGRSYFIKYANKKAYYLRAGGFWIPKTKSSAMKLFYIVDSRKIVMTDSIEDALKGNTTTEAERHDIPFILNAFMKSEEGHIVLVPTEAGFTEKLLYQLKTNNPGEIDDGK